MAKNNEQLSGFQKFLVSKRFKKIMGYFYGWGAAVVMVGAYFKLTHIQGADFMLALGLGIEAVIFFLSAFEPQHVDYAWDNVFVELEEDWDGEKHTVFGTTGNAVNNNSNINSPLMDEAMSNAASATNNYAKAMEQATRTISDFANNYTKSNQQLTDSLNKLDFSALDTNTLRKVATSMQSLNSICEIQLQSMEQTSSASSKLAATMTSYMDNLNASANNANELNKQLTQLSSRLSALNNVYGGMLSAMNIKA